MRDNQNPNIKFETNIEVKYIDSLPKTIQVIVAGKDYYFTEDDFLKRFEKVALLWSEIKNGNHRD